MQVRLGAPSKAKRRQTFVRLACGQGIVTSGKNEVSRPVQEAKPAANEVKC